MKSDPAEGSRGAPILSQSRLTRWFARRRTGTKAAAPHGATRPKSLAPEGRRCSSAFQHARALVSLPLDIAFQKRDSNWLGKCKGEVVRIHRRRRYSMQLSKRSLSSNVCRHLSEFSRQTTGRRGKKQTCQSEREWHECNVLGSQDEEHSGEGRGIHQNVANVGTNAEH